MLTNWKVWDDGVSDGELVILVFMQKMNSELVSFTSSGGEIVFCYAKRGNYAV